MSERSYARLKAKTFLDLAYALNEVVFKAPIRGVFYWTNFEECKILKGAADKLMGGENMTRNYNEAKTTMKYLENRYGKFYNLTNDGQKELQKSIILDHYKDDLNRMLRRIKGDIEVAKDTQTVNVQPYNFLLVMIASLGSAGVAMLTGGMLFLNSVFSKYLDSKAVSKMEASDILNAIDFGSIIQIGVIAVSLPFFVIFIVWGFHSKKLTKDVDKRYIIKIFLEECLEDYNKITQQVKPAKQK
ncbi:hypothetical protein ACQCU3_17380 [Bacillus altitudinis]|uniref:hypothetical protein n=1 Tax=Bacillus altitudinis TaxID=293387 RepID=UPI001653CA21|nr:hypothetical protein [Bacillus altitudinis]